jgi:GTP-binding protein
VEQLAGALADAVESARASKRADSEPSLLRIRPEERSVAVIREDAAYRVRSAAAERLVSRFDLDNSDAVAYVQERLVYLGVESALARAGAKKGDEVRIGEAVFEFIPEAHEVRG